MSVWTCSPESGIVYPYDPDHGRNGMSDKDPVEIVVNLRPIDQKRLNNLQERVTNDLDHSDIWYIHTVLAQCFLPYRDPQTRDWSRKNGDFSIFLTAGMIEDSASPSSMRNVGLPYGAKPRLFQSY